jgi:hypothetical protein
MGKLSYIQFLWRSTNAHGVHSPFVFSLVTECLYDRQLKLTRREYKKLQPGTTYEKATVLYRLIRYFKAEKLLVLGEDSATMTEFLRSMGEAGKMRLWFFSPIAPIPGALDMAFISLSDKASAMPLLEQVLSNSSSRTVCVVDKIHSSPETEAAWQLIQDDPRITVTVDTYHLGLVFLRPGQAKQHFTVRLSQSAVLNAVLGVKNLYGLLG